MKKWCVGIALDIEGGMVYWTQKGPDNAGEGRIFRAHLEIPQGQTPASRQDIELVYDNLPEPIDLDLDLETDLGIDTVKQAEMFASVRAAAMARLTSVRCVRRPPLPSIPTGISVVE